MSYALSSFSNHNIRYNIICTDRMKLIIRIKIVWTEGHEPDSGVTHESSKFVFITFFLYTGCKNKKRFHNKILILRFFNYKNLPMGGYNK